MAWVALLGAILSNKYNSEHRALLKPTGILTAIVHSLWSPTANAFVPDIWKANTNVRICFIKYNWPWTYAPSHCSSHEKKWDYNMLSYEYIFQNVSVQPTKYIKKNISPICFQPIVRLYFANKMTKYIAYFSRFTVVKSYVRLILIFGNIIGWSFNNGIHCMDIQYGTVSN